ncbi:MAG TPA: hypothetical protein VMG59_12265 [Phycisphaerae bacterium]|nr:hypothetical protein [Phycisphaerae bacterium]
MRQLFNTAKTDDALGPLMDLHGISVIAVSACNVGTKLGQVYSQRFLLSGSDAIHVRVYQAVYAKHPFGFQLISDLLGYAFIPTASFLMPTLVLILK